MEIRRFERSQAAEAAILFTENYAQTLAKTPFLSHEHLNVEAATHRLEDMAQNQVGVVSIEDGLVTGYMIGYQVAQLKGNCESIYVPEWGHAVKDKPGERYPALYAEAATQWIEKGIFQHAVTVLANQDETLSYFYQNGFGLHVEDAARPIGIDEDIDLKMVRKAELSDLASLTKLEDELEKYLHQGPIFLVCEARTQAEWLDWLREEDHFAWIAQRDGQDVGYIIFEPGAKDKSFVMRGEGTVGIVGAYVQPEMRGGGIMKALLCSGLSAYQALGYTRCVVDYETQNELGKRFWRKYFNPVCQSLIRRVDERIIYYKEEA